MASVQELKQYRNIHLIGIGGTSMSGIAQILKHWGYNISGSDANACLLYTSFNITLLLNGFNINTSYNTKKLLAVFLFNC